MGDGADGTGGVDRVGADEQLAGLGVDHPAGGGAADRLGVGELRERGGDRVELVRRVAAGVVGGVGDGPQPAGPRGEGADAAFALVVEHREVRMDAGELDGPGGERGGERQQGEEEQAHGAGVSGGVGGVRRCGGGGG